MGPRNKVDMLDGAKYLEQRFFRSKVIIGSTEDTHTADRLLHSATNLSVITSNWETDRFEGGSR